LYFVRGVAVERIDASAIPAQAWSACHALSMIATLSPGNVSSLFEVLQAAADSTTAIKAINIFAHYFFGLDLVFPFLPVRSFTSVSRTAISSHDAAFKVLYFSTHHSVPGSRPKYPGESLLVSGHLFSDLKPADPNVFELRAES